MRGRGGEGKQGEAESMAGSDNREGGKQPIMDHWF